MRIHLKAKIARETFRNLIHVTLRTVRFFVFSSAAADCPGPGRGSAVVRQGTDAGQLRVRVAVAVRAVGLDVAGPRHGSRHETVPLHGRPVPGAGEPVRRGHRRTGAGRLRARQPNAPAPHAQAYQRAEAGQGHGDGGLAPAPGPVRPGQRGRDRVRCAGHGIRRGRRPRPAGGRRRRVHCRRFCGNVVLFFFNIFFSPTQTARHALLKLQDTN